MDYQKARSYIDEAHRFGGEMSLKTITHFLERLGNPQDDLQFIHIAGTNGKGSVGAYLASVLQEGPDTKSEDSYLRHCMRIGNGYRLTVNTYQKRILEDGWIRWFL